MAAPKSLVAAKKKGPLSAMSYKTRQAGRVGALHEAMGISKEKKIPTSRLISERNRLSKKSEGDKKLSATELKRLRMINAALRYRGK